jgi:hypothetical protein
MNLQVDNFDQMVKGSAFGKDGWHILTIQLTITFKFTWSEFEGDAYDAERARFDVVDGKLVPKEPAVDGTTYTKFPQVVLPRDTAPLPKSADVKKKYSELPYPDIPDGAAPAFAPEYAGPDENDPNGERQARRFFWLHAAQNISMLGVAAPENAGVGVKGAARALYEHTCADHKVQMTSFLPPFMLKAESDRSVQGVFDLCTNLLDLVAAHAPGPDDAKHAGRGPSVIVLGADLGLLLDHLAPRVWSHPELRRKIFLMMSGWHAGLRATEAVGACVAGDGGADRLFRAGLAKSPSAAEQGYTG